MTLVWVLTIAVVVALGFHFYTLHRISILRRAGVYHNAGQASVADVERLAKSGFPTLAVRCYRELHDCSLRQAREAVRNLSDRS